MKYNVGDQVKIKSRKEIENLIEITDSMLEKCGTVVTIKSCLPSCNSYLLSEDSKRFLWSDEMIEGLVEEEVGLVDKLSSRWVNEFNLPQGYIFKDENGNIINATKIVLEKKKKEYPKTFLGCCDVLGIEDTISRGVKGYKSNLLDTFQKLLICRDAYWKIAGEEKGLGKPWEPDFDNLSTNLEYIKIVKGCFTYSSRVFTFPNEEMRNAFYENFKEEIEICKELL